MAVLTTAAMVPSVAAVAPPNMLNVPCPLVSNPDVEVS